MSLRDFDDRESLQRRNVALTRLARSLMQRQEDAEDVVQDTWLAALRGRDSIRDADGWLHRVARYQASRRRRRDTLRLERERRVARPLVGGEAETDARALGALARALDELREPYRSVVRLRYEEDRSPEDVARLLGRPVATVKSQLARGLRHVRERVAPGEDSPPPRRVWGLLAWLRGALSRGALPTTASLAASAAVAILAGALGARAERGVARSATPRYEPFDLGPTHAREGELAFGPDEREPVPLVGLVLPRRAAIVGRVLAATGEPVAGARVWMGTVGRLEDARHVATSGADGSFALEDVARDALLAADGDGWLRGGWTGPALGEPRADGVAELVLRAARTRSRVVGSVVDELGRPVRGALVRALEERREPWLHAHGAWRVSGANGAASSDESGAFALDVHQHFPQAVLVSAPGFAPVRFGFVPEGRTRIVRDVVLTRGATLRGRARLADGSPAAGARVELRSDRGFPAREARAGADGGFELAHLSEGGATLVVVGSDGSSARERIDASSPIGPLEVELGEHATIRGSATGASGAPLAGWTVAARAEDGRGELLARLDVRPERVERVLVDAAGGFALGGLAAEAHRLYLLAPGDDELTWASELVPAPGGPPVRLVAEPRLARVRGRLPEALAATPAGTARRLEVIARAPGSLRESGVGVDPATGEFELDQLLPGEHELWLWEDGALPAPLGRFRVAAPATDIGALSAPPQCSLALAVRSSDGSPLDASVVALSARGGYGRLRDLDGMLALGGGRIDAGAARAGEYELLVKADGHADFFGTLALALDREEFQVVLVPGARVAIEIRAEPPLAPGEELRITFGGVPEAQGGQPHVLEARTSPEQVTRNLPLGERVVAVESAGGRSGSTSFVLEPSRSGEAPRVVVVLR